MCVGFFRCALVGVTGIFMFEESDDLQVRFLRVRADHLDGQFDAQRLRFKNVYLRRGRICCPRCGHQQDQREARNKNFCFHFWFGVGVGISVRTWAQFAAFGPTGERGEPSCRRIRRQHHKHRPAASANS